MSRTFLLIPPEKLVIENRFRTDFGDLDSLAASIQRVGLIQPVIVEPLADGTYKLIAGERRTRACKLCGLAEIPALTRDMLDDAERMDLELEENLGRKDFEWFEEVEAKLRIWEHKVELHGEARSGPLNTGWSIRDMAELLNESVGSTAGDLKLARAVRLDASLKSSKSKIDAVRTIKNKMDKLVLAAVKATTQDINKTVAAVESETPKSEFDRKNELAEEFTKRYRIGDAFEGLSEIHGVFNVLNMDPPYAINLHETRRGVDDIADSYVEIPASEYADRMEQLARVSFEAANTHAWGWMWHDPRQTGLVARIFEAAGWQVRDKPLIWVKPTGGQCSQPARWPANNWEPALWLRKGDAAIVARGLPDVFTADTVRSNRIHPTEKPLSLLVQLYKRVLLPNQFVCAPFLGSGNDIIAVRAFGSSCIGWDLTDTYRTANVERILKGQIAEPEVYTDES